MTEERREDLVKHLHKVLEEHRTAVRNIPNELAIVHSTVQDAFSIVPTEVRFRSLGVGGSDREIKQLTILR